MSTMRALATKSALKALGAVGAVASLGALVVIGTTSEVVRCDEDMSAYTPIIQCIADKEPIESDARPNFSAMGLSEDSSAIYFRTRFPKDMGYDSMKAGWGYIVQGSQAEKSMIGLAVEKGSEYELNGELVAPGVFFAQDRYGRVHKVKEGLVRVRLQAGLNYLHINQGYAQYFCDIESVPVNEDGFIPLPKENA